MIGALFPLVKIPRPRLQRAEQRREIDEPSGEHVHDLAFALDLAVDGEKPRAQQLAALAVAKSRQTITLVVPVSSSSVTKITPLAVSGRWRPMTMPAVRTMRPCGVSRDLGRGGEPPLAQAGRAAARADAGAA